MVTFLDDFDRANADLNGSNGWAVIGETDGQAGVLEIVNRYVATSLAGVGGYAAQEVSANAPTGTDQEVSAFVTSSEEGSDIYARIGVGGETIPGSQEWDDRGRMAFVELAYEASGARTLRIKHRVGSESAETTLATLTMVASGTVVQSGYYGQLIDDGALNALQHIRFVVTAQGYGLKLAAYVNNDDDDHPTLEAQLRSDYDVGTGFTETYGYFWLELKSTTSGAVVLTQFAGQDYTLPGGSVQVALRADWPTVEEVIGRIKRRYGNSVDVNLDDFTLTEMIADVWEQVALELGDQAWFLIAQDTFTLTTDTDGYTTLPAKVERPLYIERVGDKRPQTFTFSYFDSAGQAVIRMNLSQETNTTSYYIRYMQRAVRPQFPTDQIPIPDKHTMVIVYGVVRELAGEQERSPALEQTFERRYMERMLAMKKEQSRYNRQTRTRLRPRRRAVAMPYEHPDYSWRRF